MEDGLTFAEAHGEPSIESIPGANRIERVHSERGNGMETVARGPQDAMRCAGEYDVFWAKVEKCAGEVGVIGGIVRGQAQTDAGFGFIGREGEDRRQIRFAQITSRSGIENGFHAELFGELCASERGG